MKKSILLFCLAVLLILAGCEQDSAPSSSSSMPEPASKPESSLIESSDIYSEPESSYLDEPYYEESIPEEEPASMEDDPHGLVLLYSALGNAFTQTYGLYYVDPETGADMEFGKIVIPGKTNNNYSYLPGSCSGSRHFLSEDYTKLAVTKRFTDTTEDHAGWMDWQGNFFDVTEALGLQSSSDFGPPVRYRASGFFDGNFSYYSPDEDDPNQWYIPIDNIATSELKEGDAALIGHPFNEAGGLLKDKYIDSYPAYRPMQVTSWIDEQRCIVNVINGGYPVTSIIVDAIEETTSSYIPENSSRENTDGVISPDGTQIAFLSRLKYQKEADLYITSVDGGDPVKVEGHSLPLNFETYTLIGWR